MVRNYFCKHTSTFHKKELLILYCIASRPEGELITQTNVAAALDEKLTTLNYHFTKLKKRGLLDKGNRLTDAGKKSLRYFKWWDKTLQRKLRAHNIQATLHLSKVPESFWKIRNSVLAPITNGRYRGLKTELLGCTVMFYSRRKAVAILPDICGNTDEEIAAALGVAVPQLVQALEMEFEGLKVDHYMLAKFTSMHVAVVDSIIAEQYILRHGCNFKPGRIAVDKSHGRYELEAEDADYALEDVEILVRYEDLARENKRLRAQLADIDRENSQGGETDEKGTEP